MEVGDDCSEPQSLLGNVVEPHRSGQAEKTAQFMGLRSESGLVILAGHQQAVLTLGPWVPRLQPHYVSNLFPIRSWRCLMFRLQD